MDRTTKVFSGTTTSEVQDWLNANPTIIFDTIRIECNSVDNSPSGVMFTVIAQAQLS